MLKYSEQNSFVLTYKKDLGLMTEIFFCKRKPLV